MSYIPPSDSVNVLNANGTMINPATEESILLLRRMVKLLDSLATVDVQNRQRVTIDSVPVTVTVGQTTAASLLATVSQTTASLLNANIGTIGSVDPRFQFIDAARIAYATGVRANLKFS